MNMTEKVMEAKLPKGAKYRKVEVTEDGTVKIFYETVQGPVEGKWFEVNPKAIDQTLFQEKREDRRQEDTRQLILEAFAKVKKHPEQYGKPFETMFPKKDWYVKAVEELEKMAKNLGDHQADKVEQSLEWAQRIANGESWEAVCNEPDTANWYRLVKWGDYSRLVGGSSKFNSVDPASDVGSGDYYPYDWISVTVPLVVR